MTPPIETPDPPFMTPEKKPQNRWQLDTPADIPRILREVFSAKKGHPPVHGWQKVGVEHEAQPGAPSPICKIRVCFVMALRTDDRRHRAILSGCHPTQFSLNAPSYLRMLGPRYLFAFHHVPKRVALRILVPSKDDPFTPSRFVPFTSCRSGTSAGPPYQLTHPPGVWVNLVNTRSFCHKTGMVTENVARNKANSYNGI